MCCRARRRRCSWTCCIADICLLDLMRTRCTAAILFCTSRFIPNSLYTALWFVYKVTCILSERIRVSLYNVGISNKCSNRQNIGIGLHGVCNPIGFESYSKVCNREWLDAHRKKFLQIKIFKSYRIETIGEERYTPRNISKRLDLLLDFLQKSYGTRHSFHRIGRNAVLMWSLDRE